MNLIWIFLPAILLLGIITSYEDIKFGKIKNKYIIAALLYTLVAYIILILFFYFKSIPIRVSYLSDLGINFIIALVLGYFLWYAKLWSAADGKLFIAYSALVPLTAYSNSYIRYFPSLTLLVNTFVPFFIFAFFVFLVKIKRLGEGLKKVKKKELYLLFLNIFWVLWIPKLLSFFGVKLDFLSSLVIIIVLATGLQMLFREKALWAALFLCILRLCFDKTVFTLSFLKQFLIFILLISIIFFCLKSSSIIFTKTIKISGLKPGMILAEDIYKEKGKYKKEEIALKGKEIMFKRKKELLIRSLAEGLTLRDIRKIQRLYKEKKLSLSVIKIHQTLPFAPFIFAGALLTLIAKGSFLLLFRLIF